MKKIILFLLCMSGVFYLYPTDEDQRKRDHMNALSCHVRKENGLVRASYTEEHDGVKDVATVSWSEQEKKWSQLSLQIHMVTASCGASMGDLPDYLYIELQKRVTQYMQDHSDSLES